MPLTTNVRIMTLDALIALVTVHIMNWSSAAAALFVLAAILFLAACSPSEPPPAPTVTVTAQPSPTTTPTTITPSLVATTPPPVATPQPAGPPHSAIINLTLPAGSVLLKDTSGAVPTLDPGEALESWSVPTSYDFTVQSLKPQLPIRQALDGVQFCSQEYNGKIGLTQWDWANAKTTIVVAVQQTGSVTITRNENGEGRDGCDA